MNFSRFLLLGFVFSLLLYACSGSKKTITGDQAYEQKQFLVAAKLFQEELAGTKINEDKIQLTLKIAESYDFANKAKDAAEWYKKTYDITHKASYFYNYIDKLRATDDYERCITELEELIKAHPTEKTKAQKEIDRCNQAIEWKTNGSRYKVFKIDSVNTFRNEYAPVPYEKDKIIMSSDRQASTGDEKYGWTGEKFTDFYTVKYKDTKFEKAKKFSEAVNTASHEGTCTFNKNFTEMIFARTVPRGEHDDNFTQLFITHRQPGGEWDTPELLRVFGEDTMQNVGQPFMTEDGKSLYFSSDNSGGFGGKDIYVCSRTGSGWGPARNIGATVNSDKDEMFPFLRKDGILYFSSNGYEGMGGLDIFISQKNGWKFSRPQNVQAPINSGGDDFGIYFFEFKTPNLPDTIIGRGFLTSTRAGGKGGDDIYRFELRQEVSYKLEGIATETESNSILPNAIVQLYEMEHNIPFLTATDTTDKDGKYSFNIQKEKDFKVSVSAKDHFAKSELATSKNLPPAEETVVTLKRDVSLVKFIKNKQITVPNIFYDLDKADVRPDAAAILDSLVLPIMLENPELKFELGSHTDAQGSDEHNQALSQARADKVVEYLINKGIAADRLIAKGYGETQIINRCLEGVKCSDEEHQQNRRTTFRVVESGQ